MKPLLKPSYLWLLSLGFLGLQACTNRSAASDAETSVLQAANPQTKFPTETIKPQDYPPFEPSEEKIMLDLAKKNPAIRYVFRDQDKQYFGLLASKPYDYEAGIQGKLGLCDAQGRELLAQVYEAITAPNSLAQGAVEVLKDKKTALYLLKKQTLTEFFDQIYPYPFEPEKILAQVNQAGRWGWLDLQGQAHFETASHGDSRLFQSPFVSGLAKQWYFSLAPQHHLPFMALDGNQLNYALIVSPRYLVDLGLLKAHYLSSDMVEEGPASGIDEGHLAIKEVQQGSGWQALVADFYEAGTQTRNYQYQTDLIASVNEQGKKRDQTTIGPFRTDICSGEGQLRFVDKNLIEVRNHAGFTPNSKLLPSFKEATNYRYYAINAQGRIEELKTPRLFPATKYVKMTEDYFKGCYAEILEEGQAEDYGIPIGYREYPSLEQLDLMRNEIYAEYGLRFKTEKWQKYFQSQTWYKPRFDKVDEQLTEIDKHNLDLILRMTERLKQNPKVYDKKERRSFVAAG